MLAGEGSPLQHASHCSSCHQVERLSNHQWMVDSVGTALMLLHIWTLGQITIVRPRHAI